VNQVLYNPIRRYAEFKLKPESLVPKNIVFQAYSPFEGTRKFNLEIFELIAKRYNSSARAVLLAWSIFKGFQPIFKSTQRSHIEANIKAVNLNITTEDVALIDSAYPFEALHVQALERDDNLAPKHQ